MGGRPYIIFFIALTAPAIHHCVCSGSATTGGGTLSRKRCGPPQDTQALPNFAREAIRDIWSDYVPGTRCEKEQLMTEDVLTVLETLDKELPSARTTSTIPTAASRAKRLPSVVAERRSPYRLPTPNLIEQQEAPVVEGGRDDSTAADELTRGTVSGVPSTRKPTIAFSSSRLPSKDFTTTSDGWNAAVIDDGDNEATSPAGREPRTSPSEAPTRQSTTKTAPDDYEESETPQQPTTPRHCSRKKQPLLGGVKVGAGGRRLEKEPFDYVSPDDADSVTHPKQFEHSGHLPFLKEADPELVQLFDKVLNDPDTPSERRRQEEIHLLAVSYLNAKQLAAFNTWSTERRKRLREQEPRFGRRP